MKITHSKSPLVTVYIVSHNYGRYLRLAVESVINQSFKDLEVFIFDDGSSDDTLAIANRYAHYSNVRIFSQSQQGLIRICNQAIESARGKFVMRVDADDYLDENALLILVQTFKNSPDLAMVYPDYYIVNEDGLVLEHVRNPTLSEETIVKDLPAHGACSLIKKSVLLEINKYDAGNQCQDGYDLWLKLIGGKYKVKNINLPLFYYRSHGSNLTVHEHKILDSRQKIKEKYIKDRKPEKFPEVLALVPTRGARPNVSANALRDLDGKKLIDYTLEAVEEAELVSRRIVISEDSDILDHVKQNNSFQIIRRPDQLAKVTSKIEDTVLWVLEDLFNREKYVPALVMILYINTPLRRAAHIDEAVYSQLIFKTDSVVSVTQNSKFLYRHDDKGMMPLYKKRLLRHEKYDVLYEENGAVVLSKTRSITQRSFLGKTIGHVLMSQRDSVQIMNEFDFWIVEQILKSRQTQETLNL